MTIILSCVVSYGQKGELGIFGGGSYYIGDINPAKHFLLTKAAYGIFYRYNLDTRLALQASYNRGKLVADDGISKFIPERALRFESVINDFSLRFEFNFLDFFIGSKRSFFSPFIFGGASLFTFNPKRDGVELKPIHTEGKKYSGISVAMPFGIGFKFSVSDKLGIGIEWGMRKTITDYIDDVSTIYNFEDSEDRYYTDPTGQYEQNMQRGNSQNNDWYNFTGISISYKFNLLNQHKCRNQEFSK
jgi:hypothetical protein